MIGIGHIGNAFGKKNQIVEHSMIVGGVVEVQDAQNTENREAKSPLHRRYRHG